MFCGIATGSIDEMDLKKFSAFFINSDFSTTFGLEKSTSHLFLQPIIAKTVKIKSAFSIIIKFITTKEHLHLNKKSDNYHITNYLIEF